VSDARTGLRWARAVSVAGWAFGWLMPACVTCAALGALVAVVMLTDWHLAGVLIAIVAARVGAGAVAIVHVRRRAALVAPVAGIDAAGEPDVLRVVARAAGAVGARVPDDVRVTLGVGVALHREQRRSVLTIGACWLAAGSREQVTVAVAHALALDRAGAGSHRARVLDLRLLHATNLVGHGRWRRIVWHGYVIGGCRLRDAADRMRLRWADRACAQAFGLDALDGFLRGAFRQAYFDEYWSGDVEPCLVDGFAPPILAGWSAFVTQSWFGDRLADALAAAQLTVRSNAVRECASGETQPADGPLLVATPIRELERLLLTATYPDGDPGILVDVEWDAVAEAVWLPRLRNHLAGDGAAITPFEARELVSAIAAAAAEEGGPVPQTIGVALAVTLVDAGWTLEVRLGSELEVHRDEMSLLPLQLCQAAADGTLDGEAWLEFAEDAGIADLIVAPSDETHGAPSTQADSWSPQLAVPAHEAVLRLARPPVRSSSTIYLALAALLALPAGIAMIAAAWYATTIAAAIVVGGFGIAVLAALCVLLVIRARILYGSGTLTVTADGLRIEHSGLLKAPFELARGSVRAVFVDDGVPSATRFAVNATAFSAATTHASPPTGGYLWVRDQTAVVPCLAAPTQDPNVALLLADPQLAPRVRHVTATGPMRGEALVGLLLCVDDADAARAAFAPWDLTRAAVNADAVHIGRGYYGVSPDAPASSPSEPR
jgi:hypothetical protein